ncbi:hypothetical protein PIB30_017762 [Stylosanthes scabra]|uniref:Leucine-rich repeat-containing N-terminal plant-type domain-containing protein n=1 Tax=Stylosanthes scabra TaxID=79078 RepID=A0ABU6T7I7_9FABA|nr:hypothetical protein [Stylosanthes scabra]
MAPQSHSLTLKDDINSLIEIKRAIDPNSLSQSSYLNSWNFSVDPCECTGTEFLGILCNLPLDNNTSSRVTAIDLDTIGYEGFLTPAIGNLTELTVLNLNSNKFRGPLPETLGNLRKLTRLTIQSNFFTGSIPQGINNLKNLQYLDLSGNRLSGKIPDGITGLRSLTYISLSKNGFAGRIPDLSGLWQLATLDLSSNQFYGNLPVLPVRLQRLYFGHNILSGHMTPLKGLTHLKWLDVSDNRLSGAINKDIFSLHGIVHLNVSYNRFTTIDLVKYLGAGPMLRVLEAQGNQLKGHLPLNLVTYKNLTSINLAYNQFYGRIPDEYGEMLEVSWRWLNLDFNFLTGSLPWEFRHRTRVSVGISNNCLECPKRIAICRRGEQRPANECAGQRNL